MESHRVACGVTEAQAAPPLCSAPASGSRLLILGPASSWEWVWPGKTDLLRAGFSASPGGVARAPQVGTVGLGLAWKGPPPTAHLNSLCDPAGKPEGGHRLGEGEAAHCQPSRGGLLHPVPQSPQCHHAPGGQGTSWPELCPHCPRAGHPAPVADCKTRNVYRGSSPGIPPGTTLVSSRWAGMGVGARGGAQRGESWALAAVGPAWR